ncbi:MAG: hypothetical protein E4H15_03445 [Syntrophobacterales bacterium]|nr:MAG: hypothetical protein E4H15_03445 [Syntrophobacterales bacterium]
MKEQEKLSEAEYFYQRMVAEQYNQLYFKYNLSALLSASRSVLQYILEEVTPGNKPKAAKGPIITCFTLVFKHICGALTPDINSKRAAQKWYQKKVGKSLIVRFFRDERNHNIHIEPVNPHAHITLLPDNCDFPGPTVAGVPPNGQLQDETLPPLSVVREDKLKPPPPPPEYRFINWPGTEDVPALCTMYLCELEKVIKEGLSLGYISG